MSTLKRPVSVLLIVSFFLLMLVGGCTTTTPDETTKAPTQGTTQPGATTTVKKDPVTLKYTYWGSTNEKTAIEAAIKAFQTAYPYITIDAQHIPADYETKLSAMVAGNQEPDVAYLRDFFALPLAEQGKLYNIFDFIDKDEDLDRDMFLEKAYVYWNKDEAYGLSTAIEVFAFFYNKALFKAAGVADLPTKVEDALTWDELIDITKKLTKDNTGKTPNDAGFDPKSIVQHGIRFDFAVQQYMTAVYSNGGTYINDDGTKFTLNEPKAVEALQAIADLINVHHVAPSPAEIKALPSSAVSLMSGQAAIIWAGQWVLLDLGLGNTEFGVGVLPVFDTYATCPAQGTSTIFKSTKHPEESYLFWKWLADPEKAIDLHSSGLWMPLMKKYYTEPALIDKWATVKPAHPDGYVDAIMKPALEYIYRNPTAYVKGYTQVASIVTPALESAYLGNISMQEALDKIAPDVNKILEGRYDR